MQRSCLAVSKSKGNLKNHVTSAGCVAPPQELARTLKHTVRAAVCVWNMATECPVRVFPAKRSAVFFFAL